MKLILVFLAGAASLAAQYYPRHNFTFGVGGARPGDALSGIFQASPAINFAYGYRFLEFLQADVGIDTVFGASGLRDFYQSDFGPLRIRDYQFLIPFGGRALLPLGDDRVRISGGGGGAYFRYTETIRQPSYYFRIDCPVCDRRSGWGYYALTGVDVFLNRGHNFRTGVTAKMFRGHTEGDPLGLVPPVRTRDRWLQIYGEFGFSF